MSPHPTHINLADVDELVEAARAQNAPPVRLLEAAVSYLIVADAIENKSIAKCLGVARENWPFAGCEFRPNEETLPNVLKARRFLDAVVERLAPEPLRMPDSVWIDPLAGGFELTADAAAHNRHAIRLERIVPGMTYRDSGGRIYVTREGRWKVLVDVVSRNTPAVHAGPTIDQIADMRAGLKQARRLLDDKGGR